MIETLPNMFEMNLEKNLAVSLDEKNNELLRGILKPKSIRKNDFFIYEGEGSTEVGFILKGAFRSFYIDQVGNDVTKYFYVQDEIVCLPI